MSVHNVIDEIIASPDALPGDYVIHVPMQLAVDQFVARLPFACTLQGITSKFSVASIGTALFLMVRKITANAVAPGASAGATCIEMVTAGVPITGTLNTLVTSALAVTAFAAGDWIAIHPTDAGLVTLGATTNLVGLLSLHFKRTV